MQKVKFNQAQEVIFDPEIEEHRKAYINLRVNGKQTPELRFILEHPFLTIPAMMEYKISLMACKSVMA